MTELNALSNILDDLGIRAWQYFPTAPSTNDLALTWAEEGAADGSLVIADTQTAGRGRSGRQWVTRPGAALAFSLVLRPSAAEAIYVTRFTALAALSLVQALSVFGLKAELKWPNDVLLMRKKVAGILVETNWQDGRIDALVVGIGVNVLPESVPDKGSLRYPATSVSDALEKPVDRWQLLGEILRSLQAFRLLLTGAEFIQAWNAHLAMRGEWVQFLLPGNDPLRMRTIEVSHDGSLILEGEDGTRISAIEGEIVMIGE